MNSKGEQKALPLAHAAGSCDSFIVSYQQEAQNAADSSGQER
mgnify:CR=1 FL=1